MATLTEVFTNIANAIRNKTGKSDKITPANFIGQINSIFDRWEVHSDVVTANTPIKIYDCTTSSYIEQGITNASGVYRLINNVSGMRYRAEITVDGKTIQVPLTICGAINYKSFWLINKSPYIREVLYQPNRYIRMAACDPTASNSVLYMSFENPHEFKRYNTNGTYTSVFSGWDWHPDIMISGKNVFLAAVLPYTVSGNNDLNVINLSGTMSKIGQLLVYDDSNRKLNNVSGGSLTNHAIIAGFCGYLEGTGNGTANNLIAYHTTSYTRTDVSSNINSYITYCVPHPTGLLIFPGQQNWYSEYKLRNTVHFIDNSLTLTMDMDTLPIYNVDRTAGGILNDNSIIVIDRFGTQESNYGVSYHYNQLLRYDSGRTRSWINLFQYCPQQLSYFGTINNQKFLYAYEYRIRKLESSLTVEQPSYGEAFWDSLYYKYGASNSKYAACWADNSLWIMSE